MYGPTITFKQGGGRVRTRPCRHGKAGSYLKEEGLVENALERIETGRDHDSGP
jgi:hypothetical protein